MFGLFSKPSSRIERFFERFGRRTVIVHRGFDPEWLEQLLKLPGGAGHFRVDARRAPGRRPTPIEWLVHEHLLALELPLPLLVKVGRDELLLRHLTRAGGGMLDPSEIGWILDEIDTRYHARLSRRDDGFEIERGLPVSDNEIDYDFSL